MIQIDEKWIGGRVRDLEDMCGGEKSREKNKIKEIIQTDEKIFNN